MLTRDVIANRLDVIRELREDAEKHLIRLQAQEDVLQGLLDIADGKPPHGLSERYLRLAK